MKPPFLATKAFSLIEVTLALGIAAFALVALLGLFSVGLSSNRSSANQTAIAQIASQMLEESSSLNPALPGSPIIRTFTTAGMPASTEDEAYYHCELMALPASGAIADLSNQLLVLHLKIQSVTGTQTIFSTALKKP